MATFMTTYRVAASYSVLNYDLEAAAALLPEAPPVPPAPRRILFDNQCQGMLDMAAEAGLAALTNMSITRLPAPYNFLLPLAASAARIAHVAINRTGWRAVISSSFAAAGGFFFGGSNLLQAPKITKLLAGTPLAAPTLAENVLTYGINACYTGWIAATIRIDELYQLFKETLSPCCSRE